jgi:acetyl-CoA synthetase
MEDIKPKKHTISKISRSILSVGEPLNAEAVIWGEENFGFYYGQLVANGNGGIMIANYPSMKVKPGSMGKPLPGVEIAIARSTVSS